MSHLFRGNLQECRILTGMRKNSDQHLYCTRYFAQNQRSGSCWQPVGTPATASFGAAMAEPTGEKGSIFDHKAFGALIDWRVLRRSSKSDRGLNIESVFWIILILWCFGEIPYVQTPLPSMIFFWGVFVAEPWAQLGAVQRQETETLALEESLTWICLKTWAKTGLHHAFIKPGSTGKNISIHILEMEVTTGCDYWRVWLGLAVTWGGRRRFCDGEPPHDTNWRYWMWLDFADTSSAMVFRSVTIPFFGIVRVV